MKSCQASLIDVFIPKSQQYLYSRKCFGIVALLDVATSTGLKKPQEDVVVTCINQPPLYSTPTSNNISLVYVKLTYR